MTKIHLILIFAMPQPFDETAAKADKKSTFLFFFGCGIADLGMRCTFSGLECSSEEKLR